jgi:hypothetical protein
MLTPEIWDGVQCFLDNYVKPEKDDFVLVAYSPDSRESAAWVCVALKARGVVVQDVWMAPIRDDSFLDRLKSALIDPSHLKGRLILMTFERDTMSHDNKIKDAISGYDKSRCLVFRAISACEELFTAALKADPDEIDSLNAYLLGRFMAAKKLHVETPSGSSLDIILDNTRYQWISNRGKIRPGRTAILPPGEVATFPAGVYGRFIADFAFNLNAITRRDTRLSNSPVMVELRDGKAVKYNCSDLDILRFLTQCFDKLCASRVGEIGFGTNRNIGHAIAMNSHINERKPGIHIGFGQHNQDAGIVPYQCDIHLDLIAAGGSVWVDNDKEAIDLSCFSRAKVCHPAAFRDEDVFSPNLDDLEVDDCCGILRHGKNGLAVFETK